MYNNNSISNSNNNDTSNNTVGYNGSNGGLSPNSSYENNPTVLNYITGPTFSPPLLSQQHYSNTNSSISSSNSNSKTSLKPLSISDNSEQPSTKKDKRYEKKLKKNKQLSLLIGNNNNSGGVNINGVSSGNLNSPTSLNNISSSNLSTLGNNNNTSNSNISPSSLTTPNNSSFNSLVQNRKSIKSSQHNQETLSIVFERNKVCFDDLSELKEFDEDTLIFNIQTRFKKNIIYTNIGPILVSVNPFQILPTIYSQDILRIYNQRDGNRLLPPHLFSTTEKAYMDMIDFHRNQIIFISGESGSGKSENTKLIVQYLLTSSPTCDIHISRIKNLILESNSILEAFGHCSTVHNLNSSRWGKYFEIYYNYYGEIQGSKIYNYFLDESRVTFQSRGERNFHIFYQFLIGTSDEEKRMYSLGECSQYHYLNQGGTIQIDEINDSAAFERLKMAFLLFDFTGTQIDLIFKTLSFIINLGNITFYQTKSKVEIKDKSLLELISNMISFDQSKLELILLENVNSRDSKNNGGVNEAIENRDSLAKSLYSTLFHWIVDILNSKLIPQKYSHLIGLLDLFGQENTQFSGSYEQFSINFLEEQLQQIYIQTILKSEQVEYKKEVVPWPNQINVKDNFDSVDLMEKIVSLMDQESKNQNSNDSEFFGKLSNFVGKHPLVSFKPKKFGVEHFFGTTFYDVKGFISKNRDEIYQKSSLLYKSSVIKGLFSTKEQNIGNDVDGYFKTSRRSPLSIIKVLPTSSNYHFIRCLKPNSKRQPGVFDQKFVLEQVKTLCLHETTKIQRFGYTVNYPRKLFFERFSFFFKSQRIQASTQLILEKLKENGLQGEMILLPIFQMGQTKVFCRYTVASLMELERQKRRYQSSIIIQQTWRMYRERKKYHQLQAATLVFQKVTRRWLVQRRYYSLKTAVLILESNARMIIDRSNYLKLRQSAIILQTYLRSLLARNYLQEIFLNGSNLDSVIKPISLHITPENTPPTSPSMFFTTSSNNSGNIVLNNNNNNNTSVSLFGHISLSNYKKPKIPSVKIGNRNQNSRDSPTLSPVSPLSPNPSETSPPNDNSTPSAISPPISPKKYEYPLESPRKYFPSNTTTSISIATGKLTKPTTLSAPASSIKPTNNSTGGFLSPNNVINTSSPRNQVPTLPLTIPNLALGNKDNNNKDSSNNSSTRGRSHSLNRRKSSPQLVPEPVSPGKQQQLLGFTSISSNSTTGNNANLAPNNSNNNNNPVSPRQLNQPQQSPRSKLSPSSPSFIYFPSTSPSLVNKAFNSSNGTNNSLTSAASSFTKPAGSISASTSSYPNFTKVSGSPSSFSSLISSNYSAEYGPPSLPIYKASYLVNTNNHLNNLNTVNMTVVSHPLGTPESAGISPNLIQHLQHLQQPRRRSKSILIKQLDSEEFQFILYAKQYFELKPKKSLIRKKLTSYDVLISFSKKLNSSLHKMPDPYLEKLALEIFSNILQYMGDHLERKKSHNQICSFIIGQGLIHLDLRDEIYCQIIKQITNHPGKRENKIKGWELFAMACGSFVPNPRLLKYVTSFLHVNSSNIHMNTSRSSSQLQSNNNNSINEDDGFASYCIARLDAIASLGGCRSLPPVESEIEAVRRKVSLRLPFNFPDDVGEDVDIDSTTTAGEVTEQLTKLSKLNSDYFIWSIFEVWKNKERSLMKSEFILDIVSKWENYYHSVSHYNHSSHAQEAIGLEPFQFYFKIQLFLKPQKPPAKHEAQFLFHQLLRSVSKRHLPMTESELIKLSALRQHYDILCNLNIKTHVDIWQRYIPEKLLLSHSPKEWSDQIQLKYKELYPYFSNLSKEELCNVIITYMMSLPFYGTTLFYDCTEGQWSEIETGAFEGFYLGIDINGIHIISKEQTLFKNNPNQKKDNTTSNSAVISPEQKLNTPRSIEINDDEHHPNDNEIATANENSQSSVAFSSRPQSPLLMDQPNVHEDFDSQLTSDLNENEVSLLKALGRPEKKFKTIESFSFTKLRGCEVDPEGITAVISIEDEDLLVQSPQAAEIVLLINNLFSHLTLDSNTAIAIRDYIQPSDSFSFKKDDIISNILRIENGWCTGTNNSNGNSGTFPLDYVRLIISEKDNHICATHIRVPLMNYTEFINNHNNNINNNSSNSNPLQATKANNPNNSVLPNSGTKSTKPSNNKPPVNSSKSNKKVGQSSSTNISFITKDVEIGSKHPLMQYSINRFRSLPAFKLGESLRHTTKINEIGTFIYDLPLDIQKELDTIYIDIMKYMGDYPLPPKEHKTRLLQNIIQRGINKVKLRDEIFFFLCRQLTLNPINEAIRKGMVLFSLCSGCFPSSAELFPYLRDFLTQIENPFSQYCIKKLQSTALKGPRLYAPSKKEIHAVKERKQISCKIHLANGPVRAIEINPSTTAVEALKALVEQLELTNWKEFAIYKDWNGKEQCLKEHEKIADILKLFEDIEKKSRTRNKTQHREQEHGSNNLDEADDELNSNIQELQSTHDDIIYGRLVLLRKVWIPHTSYSMSNGMLELMFYQYVHDVLAGKVPGLNIESALSLAALQLQAQEGDYNAESPVITEDTVSLCIPSTLVNKMELSQWVKEINKSHSQLAQKSITPDKALTMYLGKSSTFPFSGTTWFTIYMKPKGLRVWIGFNQNFIVMFDKLMENQMDKWDLDEVSGFTYRDDSFSFLIGDLINPTRKLFYTNQGDEINEIYETFKSLPKLDDFIELEKRKERKRERKEKEKRKAAAKLLQQTNKVISKIR